MQTIDPSTFRRACGTFPTGVAIVTRNTIESTVGITVNSFSSVSLEPPMILICVHKQSRFLYQLSLGDIFVVNVLNDHQEEFSRRFSRRTVERAAFGSDWRTGVHGAPVLIDAITAFECELRRSVDSGDHVILLGDVLHLHQSGSSDALVFHTGAYWRLEAPVEASPTPELEGHVHA